MKMRLLILTASLSLTVALAQTNKYFPLPDSNATWFSWKSSCPCPPGIQLEIWDWFTGDTIIGSFTYKKIQEYTFRQNDGLSTFGYVGAIRQDTSQKKVFYRLPSSTADTLLYDFNLSVGDTIPKNWYINSGTHIISSIDSILVGATYHKRFNFPMAFTTEALIEGVGSTMGLLLPLYQGVEYSSFLYCFTENGQNLFIHPNGFCDTNPTNIDEQEKDISLTISPNPFSRQAALQAATPLKNASLAVYNSVGQTVRRMDNLAGQTISFHRDNLPSGLYFILLMQDDKVIATDKLVIIDN
jgi:Secretion system C-terminal sorting domain